MNRIGVSPKTKALAEHLLAFEETLDISSPEDAYASCRVSEKLRRSLIALTGTAGFCSLLSRALTLAKRDAPSLSEVQVQTDGSLEGLEGDTTEGIPILVAHLLDLLTTFIGETLLMRLLHDIWPNLSDADISPQRKVK